MSKPQLTLYTYFRSSAATRVRTLLSLQGTPYEPVYIHLLKGDQKSDAYMQLNPSAAVPTLKVADGADEWYLTQSAAIMEYLDAVFGAESKCGSLMPRDERGKALVRSIIDVLVCDMQPLANLKTLQKVKAMGADSEVWAKDINEAGLKGGSVRDGADGSARAPAREVLGRQVCVRRQSDARGRRARAADVHVSPVSRAVATAACECREEGGVGRRGSMGMPEVPGGTH